MQTSGTTWQTKSILCLPALRGMSFPLHHLSDSAIQTKPQHTKNTITTIFQVYLG